MSWARRLPCSAALLAAACALACSGTPPAPAWRAVPQPAPLHELEMGAAVEGRVEPGQSVRLRVAPPVPGTVAIEVEAEGFEPLVELVDGEGRPQGPRSGRRLVVPLAAGAHALRLRSRSPRGSGDFVCRASWADGSQRHRPLPLEPEAWVELVLPPRASAWLAAELPPGAWRFEVAGVPCGLALFSGSQRVDWAPARRGSATSLERELDGGRYLLRVAAPAEAGGAARCRVIRRQGGSRAEAAPLPFGSLRRARLLNGAPLWHHLVQAEPGLVLFEAWAEEPGLELDVRGPHGGLLWREPGAGGRSRCAVHLDPGRALVELRGGRGQVALRALDPERLAPDAEVRGALAAGQAAAWVVSLERAAHCSVEVAGEVEGTLALLDAQGRPAAAEVPLRSGAGQVERELGPGLWLVLLEAEASGSYTLALERRERPAAPGPPALVAPGDERACAGLVFRAVPPGEAVLGASELGPGGEPARDPHSREAAEPRRSFRMPPGRFVSKHEVTQRAWALVMGGPAPGPPGGDVPVHDVTAAQAEAFCQRLTERARAEGGFWSGYVFRLPDEAEWEYCARAGTRTPIAVATSPTNRRPFSFRLRQVAWFQAAPREGRPGPYPVGTRAPNPWGLYDVHGNVAEWCRPDPALPAPPPGCVPCRGGAWTTGYEGCRVSNRDLLEEGFASPSTGFRVLAVPRGR